MSWGRTDDGEVLDPDIGSLTDTEYRALHALQQYCLREHRDDGTFHVKELRHAIYARPDGPKAVSRRQLDKFLDIGLIEPADDPPTGEEREKNSTPNETTSLCKVHNWEKYNPPRDSTSTERKRRQRANEAKPHRDSHTDVTDESRRDDRDQNRDSHARQRLRPPSRPVLTSNEVISPADVGEAANGTNERDDELWNLLKRIGGNDLDYRAAQQDVTRAKATAHATIARTDLAKPIAWYRKVWATGEYPAGAEHVDARPVLSLMELCEAYVRNMAVVGLSVEEIRPQLREYERRRDGKLSGAEWQRLEQVWHEICGDQEGAAA